MRSRYNLTIVERTWQLAELADRGSWLISTHMPFRPVGRVAASGNLFRWVPAWWDY
ncbi:hypothetical protein AGR7A_pAt10037 [Agrobacterium deltaense NCPPB 1641]|uniref:Uncharacterized protein n=1 Tax=Agrobacterium deltaense NCPPB 1641 TaxID=1183425 RepID=A0A1S7U768_9HYPH|nr:hypothetical protein AGR7A_pAt10037 [Agrobacterium deltaense NCPPB 1641]